MTEDFDDDYDYEAEDDRDWYEEDHCYECTGY